MIDKITRFICLFFFAVCLTGIAMVSCGYGANLNPGVLLSDDHGTILYDQNREKRFVPASILKILTSLAAIHILGQDYRFPTDYCFDKSSKNIYIKGLGDPLFISEVIERFCHEFLFQTKTERIHDIILDQTYFSEQIQIPGKGTSLNPYDAPAGALCANFNTLMFKWDTQKKKFISAEPQTPLLSVFINDIEKTSLLQGRILLTRQQSLFYPGLLIKYFLEKNDIIVTGSVVQGKLEPKGKNISSFFSPFDIKEIVQKLLKYSNNYIANQLLLSIGAKTYGAPATLEKGVKAIQLFSKNHLKLTSLTLLEGSGLSRANLITPDQMLKVLLEFMPFHLLLKRQENDFFKTGTLTDVRTRAGYILGEDNRLYPYVIMVNQKNIRYESIRKDLINRVSQRVHKKNN